MKGALLSSQILAVEGKAREASAILSKALETAPPGFALWTLPIEPFFHQLSGNKDFTAVFARLTERAN